MHTEDRRNARYIDHYAMMTLADFTRWQNGEDVDTISHSRS